MKGTKPRVLCAMSGGVDSSVAAALLCRQGYDVVGVTLRLWDCDADDSKKACCGIDQVAHARAVADRLAVPHYVVDGRERFEGEVLARAWKEYERGRTPNPCVVCNERLKFGLLLEKARALSADRVATGHYARIDGGRLYRGRDREKDQSYFLFALSRDQLEGALFPLGDLCKGEVRALAREMDFPNADKAESQDACLTAEDGGFAEALRLRFGAAARPGKVVDRSGKVLAEHDGIHRFTIGQRRGLGVALGRPAYVKSIDFEKAEVVVGEEEADLMAHGLIADAINWIESPPPSGSFPAEVQIRYRHRAQRAEVERLSDGKARVRFERPARAATPGQAAVFYRDDAVIGGGWIESTVHGDG